MGGGFKYFWNCHPDPWGFMIQFDLRIFFKWVVKNHQLEMGEVHANSCFFCQMIGRGPLSKKSVHTWAHIHTQLGCDYITKLGPLNASSHEPISIMGHVMSGFCGPQMAHISSFKWRSSRSVVFFKPPWRQQFFTSQKKPHPKSKKNKVADLSPKNIFGNKTRHRWHLSLDLNIGETRVWRLGFFGPNLQP